MKEKASCLGVELVPPEGARLPMQAYYHMVMITATARLLAQPTALPLQLHKAQLGSPFFCCTERRLRSTESQLAGGMGVT